MAILTRQEIRDEGFTDPPYTDARVDAAILAVEDYIEKKTNNFFDVRTLTLNFDGNGLHFLPLLPVVSITSVKIFDETIDSDDYVVYNRHLFGNTMMPNDQANPKIQFKNKIHDYRTRYRDSGWVRKFTKGSQNIEVVGQFGFRDYNPSEPDPANPIGVVPPGIKQAAIMLFDRFVEEGASPFQKDAWKQHHLVETQTRNQRMRRGGVMMTGKVFGSLTGDLEIDMLLSPYVRSGGVSLV